MLQLYACDNRIRFLYNLVFSGLSYIHSMKKKVYDRYRLLWLVSQRDYLNFSNLKGAASFKLIAIRKKFQIQGDS